DVAENIISNLRKFYPYIPISQFPEDEILALMLNDKKNNGGKISFSLLDKIGTGNFDREVSREEFISALHYYQNLK
ncbi:MAG: 3-dehydroquinate synthase, partial [Kaistella sp.]